MAGLSVQVAVQLERRSRCNQRETLDWRSKLPGAHIMVLMKSIPQPACCDLRPTTGLVQNTEKRCRVHLQCLPARAPSAPGLCRVAPSNGITVQSPPATFKIQASTAPAGQLPLRCVFLVEVRLVDFSEQYSYPCFRVDGVHQPTLSCQSSHGQFIRKTRRDQAKLRTQLDTEQAQRWCSSRQTFWCMLSMSCSRSWGQLAAVVSRRVLGSTPVSSCCSC